MKKIIIGLVIFICISLFIFPIHAETSYQAYREDNLTEGSHSYALYIQEEKPKLVYCFNHLLDYPIEESKLKDATLNYQRLKGNEELFKQVSQSKLNKEELYKRILTVLWHGYPNNNGNIQSKYSLTNEEMRDVTQEAVWHFTDNTEINETNINKRKAYEELVNMPIQYPDNLTLHIYKPISIYDKTDLDKNDPSIFQYLLSTEFIDKVTEKPAKPATPSKPQEPTKPVEPITPNKPEEPSIPQIRINNKDETKVMKKELNKQVKQIKTTYVKPSEKKVVKTSDSSLILLFTFTLIVSLCVYLYVYRF